MNIKDRLKALVPFVYFFISACLCYASVLNCVHIFSHDDFSVGSVVYILSFFLFLLGVIANLLQFLFALRGVETDLSGKIKQLTVGIDILITLFCLLVSPVLLGFEGF